MFKVISLPDGGEVLAFLGDDLSRLVRGYEVVRDFSTIKDERCQHRDGSENSS